MQIDKQNTSMTMERSPSVMALDNLVRRKLRVSDPADAGQIADALKKIYQDESHALDQEAAGVPFLQPIEAPLRTETEAVTRVELKEAISDVNRDLTSLTNNALVKDAHPELNGWATAIRTAIADGTNAARFSLDPRQRDKAFATRRLLGGYARVARYVGALTPTQSLPYRRLAQSLDEVASVILVMMGDALANIGYSGGKFLLQVPASELQGRRDAVIYALRNLTGSVQEGYGPNDWPRGLLAYRQLLKRLEEAGQTDLRSLFVENHIARIMDDLVHWTTSGSADDLRALGSTAHLALEQFQRLIRLGQRLVDPEAPPLASFFSAIQLFVDGFVNGAIGHRLLYVSRPAILSYGLYGFGEQDDATKRLLAITQARGNLANKLDCYLGCDCSKDQVKRQIILDKILYDVDRSIDLYTLGSDNKGRGEPETRAAAFGFLIKGFIELISRTPDFDEEKSLIDTLVHIQNLLWWASIQGTNTEPSFNLPKDKSEKFKIFFNGAEHEINGFKDINFPSLRDALRNNDEGGQINSVFERIEEITKIPIIEPADVPPASNPNNPNEDVQQEIKDYMSLLNQMHQELCIQRDIENGWENLLATMAPSCRRFDEEGVIATRKLLNDAINAVSLGQACPSFDISIPPAPETNGAAFAYLRNSDGGN